MVAACGSNVRSPLVAVYQSAYNNTFLNTQIIDKRMEFDTGAPATRDDDYGSCSDLLREAGDMCLTGYRFLFGGKNVEIVNGRAILADSFKHDDCLFFQILKTFLAIITLPFALLLGSILKGFSYIAAVNRNDHALIQQARNVADSKLQGQAN